MRQTALEIQTWCPSTCNELCARKIDRRKARHFFARFRIPILPPDNNEGIGREDFHHYIEANIGSAVVLNQ